MHSYDWLLFDFLVAAARILSTLNNLDLSQFLALLFMFFFYQTNEINEPSFYGHLWNPEQMCPFNRVNQ